MLPVSTPVQVAGASRNEARIDADQVYMGTCYQRVDRTQEEVLSDITLVKKAGLRVVRIGDLS